MTSYAWDRLWHLNKMRTCGERIWDICCALLGNTKHSEQAEASRRVAYQIPAGQIPVSIPGAPRKQTAATASASSAFH